MAYDDPKQAEGRTYTGMQVGRGHAWDYPDGVWLERKASPDRWDFSFEATKRRRRTAPDGSGARLGTQYHWFILAHQHVRKLDANAYETLMEGVKYKVAHKRPHWRKWSSEYPDQPSETQRLKAILAAELHALDPCAPSAAFKPASLLAES